MDNYSKIYDNETRRQLAAISNSIKEYNTIVKQMTQVHAPTMKDFGMASAVLKVAEIACSYYPAISAYQAGVELCKSVSETARLLSQEAVKANIDLINSLKPQFDFTRYGTKAIEQVKTQISDSVNWKLTTKGLSQALDMIPLHDTNETPKVDTENDVAVTAASEEEITQVCSIINDVIADPQNAIQIIESVKDFLKKHPVLCQILIGVLINILSAIMISAPDSFKETVTKNINATVKESLDEPQKEKTKLAPGTSVIIVDETTPRYYEVEYTDPETGERKCGYVVKQCVIKTENVHEERVGD